MYVLGMVVSIPLVARPLPRKDGAARTLLDATTTLNPLTTLPNGVATMAVVNQQINISCTFSSFILYI